MKISYFFVVFRLSTIMWIILIVVSVAQRWQASELEARAQNMNPLLVRIKLIYIAQRSDAAGSAF